jgi:CheY-like chemotaxis protein
VDGSSDPKALAVTITTARTLSVLLVEDNPSDVALVRALLTQHDAPVSLVVAQDGEEAIAALKDAADHARADLVLLDLNLPGKNGAEVLEELKQHPELRRIPVIMLTDSAAQADVRHAYDHHANAFLTKPVDLDQFSQAVKALGDFWFRQVLLDTSP